MTRLACFLRSETAWHVWVGFVLGVATVCLGLCADRCTIELL